MNNKIKEYEKYFLDLSETCIEAVKNVMGINLYYDENSIYLIDKIISEAWPNGSKGDIEKRLQIWGSYLGECIRKIHNGKWVYTESGWWGIQVKNVVFHVFNKMEKRFINGMKDSIGFSYDAFLVSCGCKEKK
jgi:hypothetical protein